MMSSLETRGRDILAKQSNDFGVLYFVDENPEFNKMLKMSIQSLKRFHPDWPIHIVKCTSYAVPTWKKAYRFISFWKRKKRFDRAGQDIRVYKDKLEAWMKTPFNKTLFLDVDTIVMRPLHKMKKQADNVDVMLTPLNWKKYQGIEIWHPKTFPYLMSGVVFYNSTFLNIYKKYADRMATSIYKLPTGDQYVFSMACELEASEIEIMHEPSLQVDVINIVQHLGTDEFPRLGECLDLTWEGLSRFHVFHYNEYKPQYMQQIKDVWGYPLDE